MEYRVLTYGHAALKAASEPVGRIDDGVRKLARDMLAAMYRANGVGLAAQQVGRREAVCVIDTSPRDAEASDRPPENPGVRMPIVMINPRVTRTDGQQRVEEGCLSFPEVYVTLTRAAEVTAAFTDLSGQECTVTARGLLARAIQHEMDHLHGVLLVDRMSAAQKIAVAGKLRRLRRQAAEEEAAA